MKILPLLVLLLLVPAVRAQSPYNDYVAKLKPLLELNDDNGLDKLMRQQGYWSVMHVMALVAEISVRADDATKKTLEALRASFKRVYNTDTIDRIERYYAMLGRAERDALAKADNVLDQVYKAAADARHAHDRKGMESARQNAMKTAQAYEHLGHALKAADAWALVAQIILALPDITVDEQRDAVFALQRFKELRESWAWTQDSYFPTNVNSLKAEQERLETAQKDADKRKSAGYAEGVKGPDALVIPGAAEEIADLKFKVVASPPEDMFVRGGSIPPLWLAMEIKETGPMQFILFKKKELFMVRPALNKFGITVDGKQQDMKKNDWQEIEVSGRPKPSLFHLGDKGDPYAMLFYMGSDQENLMGVKQNLAPEPKRAVVFYRSASSWTATINGETVTFFDDNCDGKLFAEDPYAYDLKDRTLEMGKDTPVPAYDSMQVGKGPIQPYSSFASIGGKWFYLRAQKDGAAVGARPLNPEFFHVGNLQLKWTGPKSIKPEVLVVRGRGQYAAASFNLATGKPVEVPAGEYELSFGRISEGHGGRAVTAQIFKGESAVVTVEQGKTADMTLGEPFKLDFQKQVEGDHLVLDTLTIQVKGTGGELYTRINGAVPTAEVLVAKTADGKGAKAIGELVPITTPEQLNDVAKEHSTLGNEVGFFPVVKGQKKSPTMLKEKVPAGMLVGLQDKKNRLFGKLVPVFK